MKSFPLNLAPCLVGRDKPQLPLYSSGNSSGTSDDRGLGMKLQRLLNSAAPLQNVAQLYAAWAETVPMSSENVSQDGPTRLGKNDPSTTCRLSRPWNSYCTSSTGISRSAVTNAYDIVGLYLRALKADGMASLI